VDLARESVPFSSKTIPLSVSILVLVDLARE